jgi:hypothetical protein
MAFGRPLLVVAIRGYGDVGVLAVVSEINKEISKQTGKNAWNEHE